MVLWDRWAHFSHLKKEFFLSRCWGGGEDGAECLAGITHFITGHEQTQKHRQLFFLPVSWVDYAL